MVPHPLTKPLVATIVSLKERGDVAELKRVLEGINEGLAVSADNYNHLLEDAEANRQKLAVRLPKEMRDAAAAKSLEFKASPPFYRVAASRRGKKKSGPTRLT